MILAFLLAAAIAATSPAPPGSNLSPQAQALIAPVHQAIARTRAELAALPPPRTDTEKLVRMQKLEQAPRSVIQIDMTSLSPEEKVRAQAAIWSEITPIDEANQAAVLAMLPPEGWFTISKYGADGSTAAFLIIQHSNIELWRRFVPVLETLAAKGEVRGAEFALMYDRLALHEHRPQRYGSQMTCKAGKYVPDTLEDPEQIDQRRATLGMIPYKDYLAMFADNPPC
jgi:hypothetical protein